MYKLSELSEKRLISYIRNKSLSLEETSVLEKGPSQEGDDIVKKYMMSDNGRVNQNSTKESWLKYRPAIKKYLLERYKENNEVTPIKMIVKRIIDHIDVLPLCPYCGKPVEYVGKPSLKFRKYCSKSCANLDPANQSLRKSLSMQRWGYESPSLSPEVKKKISTSLKAKSEEMNRHRVETWIDKYGVDNVMKLKQFQDKSDVTKKERGSYKTSSEENILFDIIKEKYPDAIHSYKCDRYPFNCDYYIPSLDLFIEYQGFWTHGDHPYDETNEEDIRVAKNILDAGYEDKYDTWVIRDPHKRKIARDNNLNYIEIWRDTWNLVALGNKEALLSKIVNKK